MSSINTNATAVIEQLEAAKQGLLVYANLKEDIQALRQEKEKLQKCIESLKRYVNDVENVQAENYETEDPITQEDFVVDDSSTNCSETYQGISFENMDMVAETHNIIMPNSTSSSSMGSSKKRCISKAQSMSPKKWRRMIRTHRLQSILLTN